MKIFLKVLQIDGAIASLIVAVMIISGFCRCGAQTIKREDFLKPRPATVDYLMPQPVSTIKKSDFFKPFGTATIITSSVCVGGQMGDVVSSTGYEGNSFLRGSDGRMNRSKATPLKLGACALPLVFENHVPRKVRIFLRVTQIGIGALGFYDAAKNWKVNR